MSTAAPNNIRVTQKGFDVLWNNRTDGNEILLIEYDVYITRTVDADVTSQFHLHSNSVATLFSVVSRVRYFPPNINEYTLESNYQGSSGRRTFPLGTNGTDIYTDFQYDNWVSVQVFMDYTSGIIYLYIPSLNILSYGTFSHEEVPSFLTLYTSMTLYNPQAANKFDNIRISALNTLPAYLNVNELVSSKFNVFPNPASDIVTITNSENIIVESVTFYDTVGKVVKTQNCENAKEITLDVADFASGVYLLHIKTQEGVAVKKLVKK